MNWRDGLPEPGAAWLGVTFMNAWAFWRCVRYSDYEWVFVAKR